MQYFLVAGLGNPGERYKQSRHNVGFMLIDYFSETIFPANFSLEKKFQSELAVYSEESTKYLMAKPLTYMNNSGTAIKNIANFYKISPEKIIILHDDIDLELGRIKLSRNSGSAGHKGVESIIQELGTKDFYRLRVGIKSSSQNISTEKFVLEDFSKEEMKQIEESKSQAKELLQDGFLS